VGASPSVSPPVGFAVRFLRCFLPTSRAAGRPSGPKYSTIHPRPPQIKFRPVSSTICGAPPPFKAGQRRALGALPQAYHHSPSRLHTIHSPSPHLCPRA